MNIQLETLFTPSLFRCLLAITTNGPMVYLVGGAVRDLFQGLTAHDLDFVVDGDALRAARQVADSQHGSFYILDSERNYGRVIVNQEDGSHLVLDFAPLTEGGLEADLRRRDFTINAMAIPMVEKPEVIDFLGGVQDLHGRKLRACAKDAFSDDPVRVLRGVRFSTNLEYLLERETLNWLKLAVPLLHQVSVERLRDELFRMMEGSRTSVALELLSQIGALDVLLPELSVMKGVQQSTPHVLDVWRHTLAAMDALENVLQVLAGNLIVLNGDDFIRRTLVDRLGHYHAHISEYLTEEKVVGRSLLGLLFLEMLYHDSGKPGCRVVEADGKVRFLGHEEDSVKLLSRRAHYLAFSQDEIHHMTLVVGGHMRIHLLTQAGGNPSSRSIYRYYRHLGAAGVAVCLLALADTLATYGPTLTLGHWAAEVEVCRILMEAFWEKPAEVVSPPRLVNGTDLIQNFKLQPGPIIGNLLASIQEAQACGEVHSREEAINLAARILDDLNINISDGGDDENRTD